MYAFELDRLEPEDGRLVLTGHWSGVRGLRFMRPTLIVDGRSVLATLEHKPWAPQEDQPWVAAFPWSGGPVDPGSALLAVGPSITVPLTGWNRAAPALRERERERVRGESERERVRVDAEVRFLRERPATRTAEARRPEADDDAGHAGIALRAARDEAASLRRELEVLRGRLAEAERARDAARRERDAAAGQRDELARDRDAVVRVRDQAAAEREHALRERDSAVRERDEALARRNDALRHREDALVATRTLERRLRTQLADADRDERFGHEPDEASLPTAPDANQGTDPPVAPDANQGTGPRFAREEEPLGVRQVPLARAEPLLGIDAEPRSMPTSLDLWVARALGGAAALCFVLLLLTLLLTLT